MLKKKYFLIALIHNKLVSVYVCNENSYLIAETAKQRELVVHVIPIQGGNCKQNAGNCNMIESDTVSTEQLTRTFPNYTVHTLSLELLRTSMCLFPSIVK
jgi:hypothetical protein